MISRWVVTAIALMLIEPLSAIDASDRYRSPRNPERKIRRSTELIVLHTTEAPERSSLNKLSDRGEAHFCVTEAGRVYRIVDRDREAFHAGRSMWNGREDVDKFSIGIECVGHHDKPMSMVQLAAIRDLVKELKAMYHLSDDRVVCHSHVAYGMPNRWHRCRHRGRKRCGMLFAMPSVRRILQLKTRPGGDPDTRAGRLRQADDYLARVLYGRVDTMASRYPTSKQPVRGLPKPMALPTTRPKTSPPVKAYGGPPQSVSDLKMRGFVMCGYISKDKSAIKIAGAKWHTADVYYVIRNKLIPGNQVDAAHMERGMAVWVKR